MKKFGEWLSGRDPALYQEFMGSTGAIVGSCKGGPDYQVMGACSDLKKKKKKKSQGCPCGCGCNGDCGSQ